jgi:hypothetical protein
MIKLLFIGTWGIAMVAAGLFAGMGMGQAEKEATADSHAGPLIENISTELNGVPIVVDSEVKGYLIFKLSASIDRSKLPQPDFNPAPYLTDSAFRASYKFAAKGVSTIREADIEFVTATTLSEAQRRLGKDAVTAVTLEQLNFVGKLDVRGNLFKTR